LTSLEEKKNKKQIQKDYRYIGLIFLSSPVKKKNYCVFSAFKLKIKWGFIRLHGFYSPAKKELKKP